MSCNRSVGIAALAAMVFGATNFADAGFRHRCAPPPCGVPMQAASCGYVGGHYEDRVVSCTVYVNETSMLERTIVTTVCKPEVRERVVQVTRRVPYQETVTEQYVVMVQQTNMR